MLNNQRVKKNRYPQNCQKTFPGTRQIGRILTKVWISAPKKLGNSWSFSKSLLTRMYPVHSILPSNLNRKKINHSKRHTFNHFIAVHSLYPVPELYSAAPRFFRSRDTHICAAQKAAEFRPRVRMLNLDWSVTRCRNSGAQIPVATGVATWPGLCQHYSTMSGKKWWRFCAISINSSTFGPQWSHSPTNHRFLQITVPDWGPYM